MSTKKLQAEAEILARKCILAIAPPHYTAFQVMILSKKIESICFDALVSNARKVSKRERISS